MSTTHTESSSTTANKKMNNVDDASCPVGAGIEEVAQTHDVFLLDMWGVLHNGSKPYPGVLETIKKLKAAGKEMIILSNSSKRQDHSIQMLTKLGFDPNDFAQIITSGELSFQLLSPPQENNEQLGFDRWPLLDAITDRKVFVFGSGSQDEEYCRTAGWELAPMDQANLIVARGTFTMCDGQTIRFKSKNTDGNNDENQYNDIHVQEALQVAAQRQIPMLVTNPDKVRPDEGLPPMPGAIADQYAQILLQQQQQQHNNKDDISDPNHLICRIGKPFRHVYQLALRRDKEQNNDTIPVSRACMVGDALETDVAGGIHHGLTTLWVVKDGIHGPDIDRAASLREGAQQVLSDFHNKQDNTYAQDLPPLNPSLVIPHFHW